MIENELLSVAAAGATIGFGIRWLLKLDVALELAVGLGAASWLLVPLMRTCVGLPLAAGSPLDVTLSGMLCIASLGVAAMIRAGSAG